MTAPTWLVILLNAVLVFDALVVGVLIATGRER